MNTSNGTERPKKTSIKAELLFSIISAFIIIAGIVYENAILVIIGISSVLMGLICEKVAYEKGIDSGFVLGWLFSIIGFIAIAAMPSKKIDNNELKKDTVINDKYDQIKKLKELLDSGAITEEEFKNEKEKLLN